MGSLRPAGPHLHWDSVHTAAVVTVIFVDSLKQLCDWACRLGSAGGCLTHKGKNGSAESLNVICEGSLRLIKNCSRIPGSASMWLNFHFFMSEIYFKLKSM